MPSPVAPPPGCRFHTRCWLREQLDEPERCETEEPELRDIGGGHRSACHFAEEVTPEALTKAAESQARHEDRVAAAKAAADEAGDDGSAGGNGAGSGGAKAPRKRRMPPGAGMLLRGGRRKKD